MITRTRLPGLLIVALLMGMGILPASEATPPEIALAVADGNASLDALPENAQGRRLGQSDLTPGALKNYDVLFLDDATLAAAWENPGERNALKNFLKSHRALVVKGDKADLDRFDVAFPAGLDTPETESGEALPVAARAHGVYRTDGGTWEYATFAYGSESDYRREIAGDVARWVLGLDDFLVRAGEPLSAQAADDGNWQYWGSASYSYTWSPYGKLAYYAQFYYSISDASSAYDWWNVQMTQTTYPGTYLWGNNWHTSMAWVTGDQNAYVGSHQLVDWGPGNVDSTLYTQTLSFEVGQRQGDDGSTKTSTQSFGYTIDDMVVTQASSDYDEYLYVRHEFGYDSGPASGSWSNVPAWSVRVNEGNCLKVPWQNKAEWRDYGTNSYYTTWINSWREVCK